MIPSNKRQLTCNFAYRMKLVMYECVCLCTYILVMHYKHAYWWVLDMRLSRMNSAASRHKLHKKAEVHSCIMHAADSFPCKSLVFSLCHLYDVHSSFHTPACSIGVPGTDCSCLTEVSNTKCGLLTENNMQTAITSCCALQQRPTQVALA